MRSVFNVTTRPGSALTLVLCLVVQRREYVVDERKVRTDYETSGQRVRLYVGDVVKKNKKNSSGR